MIGGRMKAVTVQGEHYIVLVPEANITLVLTKQEFVDGGQRAKAWKRRQTQAQREAQAAPVAAEVRARRVAR
jgi:hypothetical protein